MTQILLATYNGEKYLQQQLDSLLAQTDTDWKLLIRDDHSSDRTPEIIEQFAAAHPDEVKVVHDHDDVWMPEKIEKSKRRMKWMEKEYGAGMPLLLHSDYALTDSEGKVTERY